MAEKSGDILTLNKEMFVWLTASDKSIAQWLVRFVRAEEACGSSPVTPTMFSLYIVTTVGVLPINSPLPMLKMVRA